MATTLHDEHFASVPLEELYDHGLIADSGSPRPLILVVDDESVIADTLAIILRRECFAVSVAYDAKSALQIVALTPPDLLLTDVVMPEMNGIELADAVMELVPDCRILLLSGQAATVDLLAKRPQAAPSFTLLAKPIHPRELLLQISQLGFANARASKG